MTTQHPPPAHRHATLPVDDRQDWTPGLGPILDDQAQQANHPMRHPNRSVPYLPSEHPPEYQEEPVPPLPQQHYDPTHALDQFSAMSIHDPIARGTSAMSHRYADPIPRGGSSMSHYPQHTGLPPHPAYQRYAPERDPSINDNSSLHSSQSGGGLAYDQGSVYSYDGQAHPSQGPAPSSYPQYWDQQQPQQQYDPSMYAQQPGSYNNLYSAASDVLGGGPPGSQGPPPGPPGPGYGLPPGQANYYYPQQAPSVYSQDPSYASYEYDTASISGAQSIAPSMAPSTDSGDPEMRPGLKRSGTTASVALRTQKTKAVDLSAPPFTKEYVDQYRQRIKSDPDPDAHFQYAKYLIEAAKNIGKDVKDQRALRKYRDMLVAESLKVMRRLATQGEPHAEAQFFLANCHGTGTLGLQVDHERAYHLYLQAAKSSHAAACYRVAVCNEIGAGTRKDQARAAAFYKKAASLGDTPAMYKLGMIFLHGQLGIPPNPKEGIAWLRRAAEQADDENPHALHELALLYEQPNSQLVPFDPVYAKNLFTHAAQLGYTPSQHKLGQCYEYGHLTCPVDPRRSIAWYTKAAEKGDPEAELAVSGWYLTGSEGILKQSDSEAYLWARRAANKGLSKAEYAVGYYAEVGIGVKQDIEFAKKWYMRAAAQGNKRAMNRLTEMKRMGNRRANVARPTRQEAKDECVIC